MNYKVGLALLVVGLILTITLNKNYKFLIVQSGSMEPSLQIGDMIVVEKKESYSKGEVITFKSKEGKIVTHRINAVKNDGQGKYFTKGDANRHEDTGFTDDSQIVGKVIRIVPKIGLLANTAYGPYGLLIFFLIPAGYSLIADTISLAK